MAEALIYQQKGKLNQAKKIHLDLLKLNPNYLESLNALGEIELTLGNLLNSYAYLEKSISIDSKQPQALLYIGNVCFAMDKFEDAIKNYNLSIEFNPNFPEAYNNRGIALAMLKKLDDALKDYTRAISLNPIYLDAINNQGNIFAELYQYDKAIDSYTKAIAINENDAEIYFNRGLCFDRLKSFEKAVEDYDLAIKLDPDYAEAYYNRGAVLDALKKPSEALLDYDRAIEIRSDYMEAYLNRGIILHNFNRFNDALINFDKVIELKPDYELVYLWRGRSFNGLSWFKESLESFKKANEINPDYIEPYIDRGIVHMSLKSYDEALKDFNKAYKIDPGATWIQENVMSALMYGCKWDKYNQMKQKIRENINKPASVFNLFALFDDPKFHRECAELNIKNNHPKNALLGNFSKYPLHKKIRVGYFSSDFQEHPVAYLTVQLFEIHNREEFETVAFSFGKELNFPIRQRLEKAFDTFINVRFKSDLEIATLARSMEIDIAVDLNGYTGGCRPNIFAFGAAPIQVNYLGYAGTTGADYMDYIIADKVVIPEETREYFSEKIAYLPDNFMPNDSSLELPKGDFHRKDFELPEGVFVFSCFNAPYKITPTTFECWMRVLKSTDNSILWLSDMNELANKNIKNKAKACGVKPERIIFAKRMPLITDHLKRLQLADLFLDTHPYNAHTTCNDALRSGLPVITMIGKGFASRVSASLLNAVSLSELITQTESEYEALAIELATHPKKIKAIKNKLLTNLPNSALNNTVAFARNLEKIYYEMYKKHRDDQLPENIYINK
jgi:predicted O-linked N-acetylglucosamine transferase (SPINDLY family)